MASFSDSTYLIFYMYSIGYHTVNYKLATNKYLGCILGLFLYFNQSIILLQYFPSRLFENFPV